MSRTIAVTDEDYKMFQAALMLTGEQEEIVMRRLIKSYAHEVFEHIMGKNTMEYHQVENQVEVHNITEREQKQLFVDWFKSLTRNGKAYNPVTISGYAGRVENVCSDPIFASVPVNNLFSITDIAQYIEIQKQIKSCIGYKELDAKSHNGLTAALRKYEEFLRFQANGNISQKVVAPVITNHQPTAVHRWTMDEDEICCKRFLECYVVEQSKLDTISFLQRLSKEVPAISEGSLRMKIQNIKYLTTLAGLQDTSTIKGLSQYSSQCERAFKKVLLELEI